MKISEEIQHTHNSKIQFAILENDGEASWRGESSVRLAWFGQDGKFDPYSSSELPFWALKDVIIETVKRDIFSKSELAEIIGFLEASIYRQI